MQRSLSFPSRMAVDAPEEGNDSTSMLSTQSMRLTQDDGLPIGPARTSQRLAKQRLIENQAGGHAAKKARH